MLKTEMENYDVVIIGAGPIGLACAIACTKRKLSYRINHLERKAKIGFCNN